MAFLTYLSSLPPLVACFFLYKNHLKCRGTRRDRTLSPRRRRRPEREEPRHGLGPDQGPVPAARAPDFRAQTWAHCGGEGERVTHQEHGGRILPLAVRGAMQSIFNVLRSLQTLT